MEQLGLFGETTKIHLKGNTILARHYLGEVKRLLHLFRTGNGFNNLKANRMERRYSDGTIITIHNSFGQEFVSVSCVPPTPSGILTQDVAVFGADNFKIVPCFWGNKDGKQHWVVLDWNLAFDFSQSMTEEHPKKSIALWHVLPNDAKYESSMPSTHVPMGTRNIQICGAPLDLGPPLGPGGPLALWVNDGTRTEIHSQIMDVTAGSFSQHYEYTSTDIETAGTGSVSCNMYNAPAGTFYENFHSEINGTLYWWAKATSKGGIIDLRWSRTVNQQNEATCTFNIYPLLHLWPLWNLANFLASGNYAEANVHAVAYNGQTVESAHYSGHSSSGPYEGTFMGECPYVPPAYSGDNFGNAWLQLWTRKKDITEDSPAVTDGENDVFVYAVGVNHLTASGSNLHAYEFRCGYCSPKGNARIAMPNEYNANNNTDHAMFNGFDLGNLPILMLCRVSDI